MITIKGDISRSIEFSTLEETIDFIKKRPHENFEIKGLDKSQFEKLKECVSSKISE